MRPVHVFGLGLVCSGVILVWAFFAEDGYGRTRALDQEKNALSNEVATLEQENALKEETAARLRGGTPEGDATLERAVRRELGYVKNDEVVLRLDAGE